MRTSRLCCLALVLAGAAISRSAQATRTYTYVSGISCHASNPQTDPVSYSEIGVTVGTIPAPARTIVLDCSLPTTEPSTGGGASDTLQKIYAVSYWSLPTPPSTFFNPGCMFNVVSTGGTATATMGFPLGGPPLLPSFIFPYSTPILHGSIGSLTLSCYNVPSNVTLNSITLDMCYDANPANCP